MDESALSKNCAGNWTPINQKINLQSFIKSNVKWIMDLNVKYENTHSRYIIAENIQDLRLTKSSYTGPQKHDPKRKKPDLTK